MPPEIADEIGAMLGWLAWGASAACVVGVLLTAGRMAVNWQRGDSAAVSQLAWVAGACVLLGSASAIVGALI